MPLVHESDLTAVCVHFKLTSSCVLHNSYQRTELQKRTTYVKRFLKLHHLFCSGLKVILFD